MRPERADARLRGCGHDLAGQSPLPGDFRGERNATVGPWRRSAHDTVMGSDPQIKEVRSCIKEL